MQNAKKVIFFTVLGICVIFFIIGTVLMCRDIWNARGSNSGPASVSETEKETDSDGRLPLFIL